MNTIKRLLIAYYRLFYFFFRIEKKDHHGKEASDISATIMALMPVSVICYCDLLTLLYLIARFLITIPHTPNYVLYSIAIVIVILNFILFFQKKRYIAIKKMFECEDDNLKLKRSIWCIVFTAFSLFIMLALIALFGTP